MQKLNFVSFCTTYRALKVGYFVIHKINFVSVINSTLKLAVNQYYPNCGSLPISTEKPEGKEKRTTQNNRTLNIVKVQIFSLNLFYFSMHWAAM